MKLSIIVPVYNMAAEGKLAYCLDSLVRQTLQDYEIIAVDDCSTDNSLSVLREYEQNFPRKIRVIALPENHRQGGAKNAGLRLAQGEFIGFMDSDDWAAPDMYERLIQSAEESGSDIASCDLCLVHEHTMTPTKAASSPLTDMSGELTPDKRKKLIGSFGALVTKVYRRAIFLQPELLFPEHMFYEDNAISTELVMRATRISYVNAPLYFYFQNPNSTVHTINISRCRDRLEAMRIMLRLSIENGYFEAYKKELEYTFANLFYQNTLFSYMQGKEKKDLSFLRSMGQEMLQTFPDYQSNAYFLQRVNEEERKFMALNDKSPVVFIFFYKLKWGVRRLKKGLFGSRKN